MSTTTIGILSRTNQAKSFYTNLLTINVDVFITETHERSSTATKYPIETGETISDHIVNNPITITVEGLISPVEITDSNASTNIITDGFNNLESMWESKELITVITGVRTYENMYIETLQIPRNKTNGGALHFTIKFTQLTTKSTQTVTVTNDILATGDDIDTQAQSNYNAGTINDAQTATSSEYEKMNADAEEKAGGIVSTLKSFIVETF